MEIEVPKLNQKEKIVLNMLKHIGCVTKQEIATAVGVSERQARYIISSISKHYPIISNSEMKGYRLATTEENFEDVIHTIREIESRVKELESRKKPLMKYYEKYGIGGRLK